MNRYIFTSLKFTNIFSLRGQIESIIGLRCIPKNPNQRKLLETRFPEFSVLSVYQRVSIYRSASETDDWLFSLPVVVFITIFLYYCMTTNSERHSEFFVTARKWCL